MSDAAKPFAWCHDGLQVVDGRLRIAGRDAEALAREHGTPVYVFDLESVRAQVRALQGALARAGLRHKVRLALKAQPHPAVLQALRELGAPGDPGSVGIDACSPGEVEHALAHGFRPDEISFTGTNLSERDLDVIVAAGVHVNVDLFTQLERVGRRLPGSRIGLRLNPRGGVMRGHPASLYSGAKPTKFGFYEEDLERAVAAAARHGLTIDTAHVHLANGMLDDELPRFDEAMAGVARLTRRLVELGCPIAEVNVGGGLGTPLSEGEEPLDLDAYAGILRRRFGDLGVTVTCEPGEFLLNEAGHLLAEVVSVEERLGVTFVGLDCGWNVMNDHYIYERELEIVPVVGADRPRPRRVTVAGHINEGNDLFAEDYPFPDVAEGEIVALVSIGGYCQSMYTTHCLRPPAEAVFFSDRI